MEGTVAGAGLPEGTDGTDAGDEVVDGTDGAEGADVGDGVGDGTEAGAGAEDVGTDDGALSGEPWRVVEQPAAATAAAIIERCHTRIELTPYCCGLLAAAEAARSAPVKKLRS